MRAVALYAVHLAHFPGDDFADFLDLLVVGDLRQRAVLVLDHASGIAVEGRVRVYERQQRWDTLLETLNFSEL